MATKELTCMDCTQTFTVETGHRSGRTPIRCPACAAIQRRAVNREKTYRWRAAHPEQNRAVMARYNAKRQADPAHLERRWQSNMRKVYGVEPDYIVSMIATQNGVCAICGRPPGRIGRKGSNGRLHVDHNHTTGAVRGMLCGNCNTMIGLAGDAPEVLERAAAYLRKGAQPCP